jgi:hypothetical protein
MRTLLVTLLLSAAALAQDVSPTFKMLTVTQLTVTGLDAWATSRVMALPIHHEYDPLYRPFTTHGNVILGASFATESVISLLVERRLAKRHRWLAYSLGSFMIEEHIVGTTCSLTHIHK